MQKYLKFDVAEREFPKPIWTSSYLERLILHGFGVSGMPEK
jgi:hypothetical protein